MPNNDDENWLEGAYLAQEEYNRDKDKWKGNKKEMESHFFSTYDTLPDTSEPTHHYTGSGSDNSFAVFVAVIALGVIFFCVLLASSAG